MSPAGILHFNGILLLLFTECASQCMLSPAYPEDSFRGHSIKMRGKMDRAYGGAGGTSRPFEMPIVDARSAKRYIALQKPSFDAVRLVKFLAKRGIAPDIQAGMPMGGGESERFNREMDC
jgi:hypothetical protein